MRHVKRRQLVSLLMLLLAVGLLAYGTLYFVARYRTLHQRTVPPARTTITHTTDKPGEALVPTNNKADYHMPADQPRLISAPAIGVSGFIQRVGVDAAVHEIAVPTNVNLAGWYTRSVKPGDPGVSLILGHVQGVYSPGIFKRLAQLQPRDQFTVAYGDGSTRSFEVVSTTEYTPKDAENYLLRPVQGIVSQLNLITCGGNYDRQAHGYDRRTIVVSKLINSSQSSPQ